MVSFSFNNDVAHNSDDDQAKGQKGRFLSA